MEQHELKSNFKQCLTVSLVLLSRVSQTSARGNLEGNNNSISLQNIWPNLARKWIFRQVCRPGLSLSCSNTICQSGAKRQSSLSKNLNSAYFNRTLPKKQKKPNLSISISIRYFLCSRKIVSHNFVLNFEFLNISQMKSHLKLATGNCHSPFGRVTLPSNAL